MNSKRKVILSVILLMILLVIAVAGRMTKEIIPQDEGILLVYADLILRGYLPYKDFSSLYTPGTFYLLSGVFYVFGENILVERLLGFAYQAFLVGGVFTLGLRVAWSTGILSAVSTIFVLRLFQEIGAYSIFGALAATIFALLFANYSCGATSVAQQRRWGAVAGLLIGIGFLFRQDIGVVGAVATIVALDPRSWLRAKFFAAGMALPAAIMLIIVYFAGPYAVFDNVVLDLLRNGPGRQLPVHINIWLVLLLACIFLNFTLVFVIKNSSSEKHMVWLSRSIAVLSVGLLPSTLQRADIWHIFYAGAIICGLSVISLSIYLQSIKSRFLFLLEKNHICILLVIAIFPAQFLYSELNFPGWNTKKFYSGDRWVYLDGNAYDHVKNLVDNVNNIAMPGEKLFVGPADLRFSNYNDTYLYFLFPKLQPTSRFLEMNPGCANRSDSGLANEIAKADLLILTSRYDGWNEPNQSKIPGSTEPGEVVRSNFCSQSVQGDWHIFRACKL